MTPSLLPRQPLLRIVRAAIPAALALAGATAAAQSTVTISAGARAGGDFIDQTTGDSTITLSSGPALSLSYEWILADGRQAQIFYSFQRSALPGSAVNQASDVDLGIHYLQAGGRVFFDGTYDMDGGYLGGGLGVTYFTPQGGLSSEIRPSGNLALGYQWMLSKQLALRAEMRGYLTLINSSGNFFCNGGCTFSIRGDTLTQFEGLVGLSFGF
jgi:hypothetical protein